MPPVATTPADGPPAATGRPRSSRGAVLGVAVAALAAVVVVLGGALWLTRDAGGTEHRFVIPAGTAERIRAGEDVELIPAELDLDVGDSITLVNDDDVQHVTGFLTVRPGETLSYRFTSAATYSGRCTLHPDGGVTIRVS